MLNTQFSPWPSFTAEEADAVARVILSNKVNYWTGNECREFEKEFAVWAGSNYAVALANGTVALDLALKALDITAGDEVIVTSRTFLASVSCVINARATPIFVDVDSDSQNLSPDAIAKAISPRTKAIIAVHLAGWPCEMDSIMEIATRHGLFVIEDCAQAHGARYRGRSVGSIGHIGAWSFCQDKIMTTGGEGGMVTTGDESLWKKMWAYKDHGKSWDSVYQKEHPPGYRWLHESFGTNWRMTEMQAVLGRIQLNRMQDWQRQRLHNANSIWTTARTLRGLRVPVIPEHVVHAAYKCYVFVEERDLKSDWGRDRILKELNELGIPAYAGSCSEVYLESAFDHTNYRPKIRLPVAKALGETSLMFLVHPTLTEEEVARTCSALRSIMERAVT